MRPAQQMVLVSEGVVDGGMDDEKALGRARGFKPLLFSLPAPDRLMRGFDPIVRP